MNKHRHHHKKKNKSKKALIVVLSVLLVIFAAVFAVGNYYLSKIDFDDGTAQTAPLDPNGGDDYDDILNSGDFDKSELADADASIRKNLDNSRVWYSDDVTNILLMGIDYGGKNYPYGRSDAMLVLSINKADKKINLISLSRAAYSAIPGYNNTRMSHAHGYGGPALAIKTVEQNYKIRIDNYVSTNFDSFKKIIDAFGGVNINLTAAEARTLGLSAGTHTLGGEKALSYARLRAIDNDRARTGRQRKVLLAIAEKAKTMSPTSLIGMLDTILPLVRTDMTKTQLVSQAASALSYFNYTTHQEAVPHLSSGLVLRGEFEVLIIDWADEVKYVHEMLYGSADVKYKAIN